MSFWWCLNHDQVEGSASDDAGCRNQDRLGPYATADQASTALEQVRARTAANDAQDEAEDDWGR